MTLRNDAVQHKKYDEFIKSGAWAEKKKLFRSTRDWPICFKCGAWDTPMDVHHLTYKRFGGAELMEDLEYVCRPCHNEIHKDSLIKRIITRKKGKTLKLKSKAARRKRAKEKQKMKKEYAAKAPERVAKYLSEQ